MIARIKSITLENFKGCRNNTFVFDGKNATVSGVNATGKTTILDAFWWCLFNKDSLGNTKFSVRPLDKDGNRIDNVEIKAVVVMDIDGVEKEFKKIQKQNWVKKRGSDKTELQGNINVFEIDGYPKSEKDYKAAVSEIINEEIFKMITNPTYFPSLDWETQREIVMRFANEVSDYDLALGNPAFAKLLDELQKAPSTDDIKAKYQKSLTELKKSQVEIPIRIDEAEKSKVDIDVAELELQRNVLKEQMAEVKAKQDDITKQTEEYQKLSDGLLELKFAEGDLQRKANEELFKKRREIEDKISDKKFLQRQTESTIADTERAIKLQKDNIVAGEDSLAKIREEWKVESERKIDNDSLVCPYCFRDYPEEKKGIILSQFEENKKKKMEEITKRGNVSKTVLEETKKKISDLETELPQHKESLEMLNTSIADLEKQLSELPTTIDVESTEEYKAIQKQIAEKEEILAKMNNAIGIRESLEAELEDLHVESMEVERKISLAQKNVEIDERISELQAELREVGNKITAQDGMIYLLEQFIRYKMNSISDTVNGKFDGVSVRLFINQINGGLRETCELTVDGVPYGSLNNGHKIIAGLQIIKALQGLYDVRMPIFVDNAESINDFNIPNMDCQLVLLKVSDDKELKVEVE